MLKRKQTKAIQKLIYSVGKQFSQVSRNDSRELNFWLVRNLLLSHKNSQGRLYADARTGFVLPIVTILLLVVALVIGAILIRTSSRTKQVIGSREEQVIYNAATPAIERGKAKLEYLFQQDTRRPTGAPSNEMLISALLNNEDRYYSNLAGLPIDGDPYTLPDEKEYGRLDINGDGKPDPVWAYEADVDNDGKDEIVVYGIFLKSRSDDQKITINGLLGKDDDGNPIPDLDGEADTDEEKAKALVTRNGPISTINLTDSVCASITQPNSTPPAVGSRSQVDESAWFPVGSGILRKTFQINAIVISNEAGTSRTVATLEFQQDRQLDRANRWGAWFRYDMEIYPGAPFNWNGAMYTAGNLFVGGTDRPPTEPDGRFRGFLISARQSCFYGKDSSEITALQEPVTGGFQGQIAYGKIFNSNTNIPAIFDLQQEGGNDSPPDIDNNGNPTTGSTFTGDNDSFNGPPEDLFNISLDPVRLFTQDISVNQSGGNNQIQRDGSWQNGLFVQRGRIRNNQQNPPYVDDTYRADNRYGPKPKYDQVDTRYWLDDDSRKNGKPIPASATKLINNTTNAVSDPDFRNLGLDGYWERRAWANGLRIIVSPRLELGNAFGWEGNNDPLYPVNVDDTSHEQQQRRTLRNNLAAVQATVVYHQDSRLGTPAGDFPIACLATTAHPGTQQTESNSKNFQVPGQTYWYPGQTQAQALVSDFFYGTGTNGWEYTVPSDFTSGSLRTALQNLANFAGDYTSATDSGAFPPTQGTRVYPNPYLAMWGNFSNLKRALALSANNSIADNSYIHTAGCVVGMLAYNISYFQNVADYNNSSWRQSLDALADTLKHNTVVGPTTTTIWPATYSPKPDDFIARVERLTVAPAGVTLPSGVTIGNLKGLARFVHMKEQINRDRQYGFGQSPTTGGFRYTVQYLGAANGSSTNGTLTYANATYSSVAGTGITTTINLGCDLTANNYFGLGSPSTWNSLTTAEKLNNEERLIILARSLCNNRPKFPSLYYIFPTQTLDNRSNPSGTTLLPQGENYLTPPTPNDNYNSSSNETFTAVNPTLITSVKPKGQTWTGGNNTANGNWYLPTTDTPNPTGETDFQITTPTGVTRFVSLIDSAFFDSREKMTVRALNIDLNLLRRNTIGNNNTWLPKSGIVYAFREDAVREDAIIRPQSSTNPNNNTNPTQPTDPQLETNGLSRKPVDFYADPDRRPYGFRLRNGQDLRRFPGGSLDVDNPRGLTFVSDNPVYIQGDFNFHSTNGTVNNLEEFNDALNISNDPTQLAQNWNNFYSRGTSGLNPLFARIRDRNRNPADTWRPSEILSDAITILSNNFQEGFIDRGIRNDTTGRYSFRAMNRPDNSNPGNGWVLENGTVRITNNNSLPIKISRNGNPIYCNANPTNGYCSLANLKEWLQPATTGTNRKYTDFSASYTGGINQAIDTRVNAIIVSGIGPTRSGQQNGGFHNFPRYIENWDGINSFISGSFVQLNFSTYATAPYNHVAWEPSVTNPSGLNIEYYLAPNRAWGYDVGLQYAPAGPLSQRFVSSGIPRSEFYRDLKVDDPYICLLRRALYTASGNRLDPASQTECAAP